MLEYRTIQYFHLATQQGEINLWRSNMANKKKSIFLVICHFIPPASCWAMQICLCVMCNAQFCFLFFFNLRYCLGNSTRADLMCEEFLKGRRGEKKQGKPGFDTSCGWRAGVKQEAWVAVFSPGLHTNTGTWAFGSSCHLFTRTHTYKLRRSLSHTHTQTCSWAKSQTGGMSRNYLLLLTNFCPWLETPKCRQHATPLCKALLCAAMIYCYPSKCKCREVTLVTHHLFHRYLAQRRGWGVCQSCQLLSWHQADPDTGADSIISSLPAVPGMSRLTNPAVSFCFLAWTETIAKSQGGVRGDDFSATRSFRGEFKGWSYCQVHSLHVKTCSSSIFARRQTT